MDCEKFENTLLDELYDELDEVTSAAAKRHAGGCSRCASLLSGFKATRRVAVLDMIEPPADLEDRILAAAKEAQKVVPIGQKMSTVVSRAGSWAMRPQTAMAALFLLMIGSSALLLRGKHASPSSMTVSDEGEPVPSATTAMVDHPADLGGSEAKEAAKSVAPSAVAAAAASAAPGQAFASAPPPSTPAELAAKGGDVNLDRRGASSASEWGGGPAGKVNLPSKSDVTSKLYALNDDDKKGIGNAAAPAGAPPAHAYDLQAERAAGGGAGSGASGAGAPVAPVAMAPSPKPTPSRAGPKDVGSNAASNGYAQRESQSTDGDYAAPAAQAAANAAEEPAASPFDTAMAAYNSGDYTTATTLFDQVAASGDANAALWAARSVREGSGCPNAAARFDQLASRAGTATATRYDAMFDAGRCYKAMSQTDRARAYFNVLLGVPRYVDRAKSELASIGPMVAARKAQPPAQQQQATPNNVQQYPAAAAPPPPASPPTQQAGPAKPAY